MGKRSRKRSDTARKIPQAEPEPGPVAEPARPRGRPVDIKARRDEAPPAPWAPLPLGEIAVFVGLVAVVLGFVLKAPALLIVGFTLVALAAVELSVREHFAGYRSHSSLLATALGLVLASAIALAGAPRPAALAVGVVVAVATFVALRRQFKALTGGLSFRA